jgi:hypothetical protein
MDKAEMVGRPVVICDIDGVIADCTHRLKFIQCSPEQPKANWDAFFDACSEDAPLEPMIRFLRALDDEFDILYVTGRPASTHMKTMLWMARYDVPLEKGSDIYMRKDGDHRQDSVVKAEIFDKYIARDVHAVFEDRDQVVQMWREKGLLCLQPKKGDY